MTLLSLSLAVLLVVLACQVALDSVAFVLDVEHVVAWKIDGPTLDERSLMVYSSVSDLEIGVDLYSLGWDCVFSGESVLVHYWDRRWWRDRVVGRVDDKIGSCRWPFALLIVLRLSLEYEHDHACGLRVIWLMKWRCALDVVYALSSSCVYRGQKI